MVYTAVSDDTGTVGVLVAVNLIASAEAAGTGTAGSDTGLVADKVIANKERHLGHLDFLIALHFSLPAT